LFFEVAGAFFEESFLGVELAIGGDEPVLPEVTEPHAEAEVGEVKEADEVDGQIDQGGAEVAEMAENKAIEHEADVAAGTGRADIGGESGQDLRMLVDVEPAGAAEEEQTGPDPMPVEVVHGLEEIAEPEACDEDRDEIGGGADEEESEPAGPCAGEPDPVMDDRVGGGGGGRDVVGVVREQGDEEEQGKGGEGDADDVGKTARSAIG
jgi:hypothetical protein